MALQKQRPACRLRLSTTCWLSSLEVGPFGLSTSPRNQNYRQMTTFPGYVKTAVGKSRSIRSTLGWRVSPKLLQRGFSRGKTGLADIGDVEATRWIRFYPGSIRLEPLRRPLDTGTSHSPLRLEGPTSFTDSNPIQRAVELTRGHGRSLPTRMQVRCLSYRSYPQASALSRGARFRCIGRYLD